MRLFSEKQISYELIYLKDELTRLHRVVKPLAAITDLTLIKKRTINAESINVAKEFRPMTEEEREREFDNMNPELVL